ncbi:MAG: hypothetical protein M3O09_15050 [Acidobacteriota bacterium]|nr:hypothetical protein [Acidobacteriota bacterium]
MERLVTFVTYGLGRDRQSTIQEFRDALSHFSRDHVIYLCSAINAILRCWERGAPELESHAHFLRKYFQPAEAERLIEASQNSSQYVFHRQQLLFVAKEAVLHCQEDGGADPLIQPPGPVGMLFLMANDQLNSEVQTGDYERTLSNALLEFIVTGEYSGHHAFRNGMARAYLMHSRFSDELSADPDFINIGELFGTLVGMSMEEFQSLCFALLWKYENVSVQSYAENVRSLFIQQSYFSQTAVPTANLDKFKEELSATPDDFKNKFAPGLKGKNDFTLFRSKPLCLVGGHLFCIDVGLLAEKLESGPFWRVHSSLPTGKRDALHRFWGKLFERYMNWMLAESIGAKNRTNTLYPNPKYQDGTEVCDAIILCDSAAVFVEYKGATFSARAKYSGDAALLRNEVERNLVENEVGRPKGIGQLAEAIRRTCQRRAPEAIDGIDLSSVRSIYPLLITRDAVGDAYILNEMLRRKFNSIATLSRKMIGPRRLTPPCCMAAQTIEQIAPYLADLSLSDIIDGRYRGRKYLGGSFFAVPNPVLQPLGVRENHVLEAAFKEFAEPMLKSLFPKEYEEQRLKGNRESPFKA